MGLAGLLVTFTAFQVLQRRSLQQTSLRSHVMHAVTHISSFT